MKFLLILITLVALSACSSLSEHETQRRIASDNINRSSLEEWEGYYEEGVVPVAENLFATEWQLKKSVRETLGRVSDVVMSTLQIYGEDKDTKDKEGFRLFFYDEKNFANKTALVVEESYYKKKFFGKFEKTLIDKGNVLEKSEGIIVFQKRFLIDRTLSPFYLNKKVQCKIMKDNANILLCRFLVSGTDEKVWVTAGFKAYEKK